MTHWRVTANQVYRIQQGPQALEWFHLQKQMQAESSASSTLYAAQNMKERLRRRHFGAFGYVPTQWYSRRCLVVPCGTQIPMAWAHNKQQSGAWLSKKSSSVYIFQTEKSTSVHHEPLKGVSCIVSILPNPEIIGDYTST